MNLLPEQQETLVNFQAITENRDTESSVSILERNNWNLELATNDFNSSPSPNPPPQPSSSSKIDSFPPTQSKRSFFSAIKSFFREMVSESNSTSCKAAEDFKRKLESQSPSVIPPFSRLLLRDIITEGKRRNKLLLIYLSSSSVPLSYSAQTLCRADIVNLIYQHYVIWAVEKETNDGILAQRLLASSSYPCMAIVALDNPTRPVVLLKLEGQHPVEVVFHFLSARFTPVQADPRRADFEREREMKSQQVAEDKKPELVLASREKEELRLGKERKAMGLEEERGNMIREEERAYMKINEENAIKEKKEKEKEQERLRKLQNIGEEPEGPESALVLFRLPDGSKIERRFHKRRPVEVLYEFLDVQDVSNVELLFGFPATILNDRNVLLCDAGIFPKALIIVRKTED